LWAREAMKVFVFRYYIKLAILCGVALVFVGARFKPFQDWQPILMILGGLLSFVYFVQKQKLEEVRLLKELFTEFNSRYDKLNECLNRILAEEMLEEDLSKEDLNVVYNYFNLCGEEYFYFRQRYIDPKVWKAWRNGMKIFYRNDRIRRAWAKELESGSHYGFQLAELEKN
jgi:hypothetical protein